MRITNIEEILVEIPLPKPGLKQSWMPGITLRSSIIGIIKITTEDGLEGYGLGTGIGQNIRPFLDRVSIPVISGLIGEPFGVEKIMKIFRTEGELGPRPYGLELALWDLIGKICKQPVYRLLGGFQNKVKAYCSTAELKSATKMVKDAQDAVEMGFKGIKLRARRKKISKDIEVVQAVRDAVGDDIAIMVDANQAWGSLPPFWSVKTAIKFGKALDKIDAAWLEEPLREKNVQGIKELRNTIETPVAGGELGNDIFFYRDLLVNDVYDIIQADITFSGGILECRKIAGMCEAFCKDLVPHAWNSGLAIAGTLQLIGAIPNCSWLEFPHAPPCWTADVRDAILTKPLLIDKRGYIEIPQGPGLGVELNWAIIEKYRVK